MQAAPNGAQPILLNYIAHREMLAGLTDASAADLATAFRQATKLQAANGTKAHVEYEAIDALLEIGQLPLALQLTTAADAGRALILDRVVPAALAAGREQDAWSVWEGLEGGPPSGAASGFPFRAAAALTCSGTGKQLTAQQQRVLREAESGAGDAADLPNAEEAVDWLEACSALMPANVLLATASTLARRLPPAGGNLEIARLRQRLTAMARKVVSPALAAQATAPLPPPHPTLGVRPSPPASTAAASAPGAPHAPAPAIIARYANDAKAGMMFSGGTEDRDDAVAIAAALLRANPELPRYAPLGTAWLAAGWFEEKKYEQSQTVADQAYAGAIAAASGFSPLAADAHWPTQSLDAFTLLAELNLERSADQARHAPPLLRPLLLAAVARAAAAPPARAGGRFTVLR